MENVYTPLVHIGVHAEDLGLDSRHQVMLRCAIARGTRAIQSHALQSALARARIHLYTW